MKVDAVYEDVRGVYTLIQKNPAWPSSCNLYAVPDDKGFSLIDVGCGHAGAVDFLVAGLKHWGLDLNDLHTVVLSHAHPDHMGALELIRHEVNPRIIIHELDAPSAIEPELLMNTFNIPEAVEHWSGYHCSDDLKGFSLIDYFSVSGCPMCSVDEVETVADGDDIRLGGFVFKVIHTPGHSPGHMSLFDENKKILLPGDLVGLSPAWYTPAAGGVTGYLDSLKRMERSGDAVALPSHGPIFESSLHAIEKMRDALLEKDELIINALKEKPLEFMELVSALYPNPIIQMFPGYGLTESHLLKLEMDGVVSRIGNSIKLI